jgi:UDP-galactopyranose mutase
MFDYLIVGAGFAGSVIARELAEKQHKKVLIIEKRNHIGGNCYDYYDEQGILVHKYGPHLFHTSDKKVFQYLSRFTRWLTYQHRVLAEIDGQQVPVPFNLNTIEMLFPKELAQRLETKLVAHFGYDVKIPILELRKEQDVDLKFLADYIYQKMFVHYTAKQWGCKPEEIAAEVTARVPVFISRDNRYFQDTYQAVPRHGYTRLFENMLDHSGISLMLNTDYRQLLQLDQQSKSLRFMGHEFHGRLIYTGLIDELFDYKFGELPYRSLQFDFEYHPQKSFQQVTTMNYPNNYDFTRITEFKKISQQDIFGTTIVKEYPQNYDRCDPQKNIPYYPVFNDENKDNYQRYLDYSEQFSQIVLLGRLAQYRYFDMDDIVKESLHVYQQKLA